MYFINTFSQLGERFSTKLSPQPLPKANLAAFSTACAKDFGLNDLLKDRQALTDLTSGQQLRQGMQPLASIYSGHQFGHYNPQLGDGRAMLLGEVQSGTHRAELQLKGSGVTPYSRSADGRAVLRSSIREYLASEAMHALGIPTTRALSIVHSPLTVYRETPETAACVLRVAPSFLRFGHIEYFHHTNQPTLVKQLLDYFIHAHMPQFENETNPYVPMLSEIVRRTAHLIAQWQAVGFAHGVMNTDNMSLLGLTIDYGPYAFLDDYDPSFICNHSDHQGRYAFNQQASIGLWNLNALAHALSSLIPKEALIGCLSEYEPTIMETYAGLMRAKLGFSSTLKDDHQLLNNLLDLMATEKTDYTASFRALGSAATNPEAFIDLFVDRDACVNWLTQYTQRANKDGSTREAQSALMNRTNPKYILRNYLMQQAIETAQSGDYTELNTLQNILATPFDEQNEFEAYAKPPPSWGKKLEISCSS